ncbi:leucine-rich repeat-containing protein 74A-like [Dysidea avara]|uniref:leucine-rich repeat-containing protein 74A-like n=1 Tax=Dysidea avara TaxID=196820 RepID=UPI00331C364D
MARTKINNDGIEHVLNALQANTSLLKLDVSDNSLRRRFTSHFAISNYIQTNATLQELSLSSTNISDEMEEIINALNVNTTLQKLVISNNYCYRLGTIISDRLKSNCTLVELDVSHCGIYASEVKKIVERLQASTTVQKLNLSSHYSSNDGVSICDCFELNSSLKKLNLTNIKLDDNEAKLIGTHIIQFNTTLEQLNISHNQLSYEAVEIVTLLPIRKGAFLNPKGAVPNSKDAVPNPNGAVPNPKGAVPNPKGAVLNPKGVF